MGDSAKQCSNNIICPECVPTEAKAPVAEKKKFHGPPRCEALYEAAEACMLIPRQTTDWKVCKTELERFKQCLKEAS